MVDPYVIQNWPGSGGGQSDKVRMVISLDGKDFDSVSRFPQLCSIIQVAVCRGVS